MSFKYETDDVIRDVTFNVEKESTISIAGKIASGKSTIITLLTKFYEFDSEYS